MTNNITEIVITHNEERRISATYQKLKDFCEIIVFDGGGSTDATEAFCREYGIKFVSRPDVSEMRL